MIRMPIVAGVEADETGILYNEFCLVNLHLFVNHCETQHPLDIKAENKEKLG